MKIYGFTLMAALAFSPAAWAGNVAHCEVLLIQTVTDDASTGSFQISSYRPAANFIASVHDDDPAYQTEIDGLKIKALLCRRNAIVPSEEDYPMMATGIPFVLSQDFDRADTDSLTIFWKDGAFDYVYKGHPLSDEAQNSLDARLSNFSARGLMETALQIKTP